MLTDKYKKHPLSIQVNNDATIKHMVEALGIPHTNISIIQVNGKIVENTYRPHDDDIIHIFSHNDFLDNSKEPIPRKFILDNHLGGLAKLLRLFGFDTIFYPELEDKSLAEISSRENRILLTRDRRLLMRSIITFGYCLRSMNSIEQFLDVSRRYGLKEYFIVFGRCLQCNDELISIEKSMIYHRLEPLTKIYYDKFHYCQKCDQIYWQGSHYENMKHTIDFILERI